MTEVEFSQHIVEQFNCSKNVAEAIVQMFTQSLTAVLLEDKSVDIPNICILSSKLRKNAKSYSLIFKPHEALKQICK